MRIALVGYGTVGRSVAKILCERPCANLVLTHICNRDVERKKDLSLPAAIQWTGNIDDVLASDADIVVEVVGGLEPAGNWVRTALQLGKSVVTANKQLIAHHGAELSQLARHKGKQLAFGASVAGGVPVLSGLQEGLAGDRLYKLLGILNGTCNFILTKVENEELSFATALRQAQEAGFAEADPTDDVDGYDARAKLTILARVALGTQLRPTDIACRSIAEVEAVDFPYAHQLGCTIRQISRAEVQGKKLLAAVSPALVPLDSPLARVSGSQNCVLATGEYGGETVFSGHGAGGNPTAVAVVSDLIAIASSNRDAVNAYEPPAEVARKVSGDFVTAHYVRFIVNDRPGIIARLTTVFGAHEINIDSVLQQPGYPKDKLPFVITLEPCSNSAVQSALQEIAKLDFHLQPPVCLPTIK